MAPSRVLIVTGDDFGLSSKVNAAIAKAHREGILTSASLMVNGGAVEEAVQIARDNPRLAVGIHLALVRGKAALSPGELPGLVDGEGTFPRSPAAAGLRYFLDRGIRPQLEMEIEAQIQKFHSMGLTPSHLDGHLHLHVHPTVLKILVPLMRKYRIPALRLPREDLFQNLMVNPRKAPAKTLLALAYAPLCACAERGCRGGSILLPDRFLGLLDHGHMNEPLLLRMLPRLKPGVTEVGMHPAIGVPPELERWAPDYEYEEEMKTLLSPVVKERIRALNIRLATYRELQEGRVSRPLP